MKKNHKPIFALVDCNNFYVSCERLFNPNLNNKPVIILSNNDGCVVSLSNEAKSLGIKVGTPLYQINNLIKKHNIQYFSSNYALYGDISSRIMNILSQFTNNLEIYSIDECFLSLEDIISDIDELCKTIKNTIQKWVGIPVSIGVANTKTLSKIANKIAKKNQCYNGIFNISNKDEDYLNNILKDFPVEDIWGIGSSYAEKLKINNIYTAFDLKNCNDKWVKKNLGGITGLRIVWELRNFSCISLEKLEKDKKQIICSKSFGKTTDDFDILSQALSDFVTRAAEKLRKQDLVTSVIQVFIITNAFNKKEKQYYNSSIFKLPYPTDFTPELIHYANNLLCKIYQKGYKFKKIGIVFFENFPKKYLDMNIFENKSNQNKSNLMKVIDEINNKFGKNSLFFASSLKKDQSFKMKQNFLSKRYTTSWDELLEV